LFFILSCGFALAQAQYKVLWNFGGAGDGISPKGTLVADAAGNLYGTTLYGGAGGNCANYCGTVYELSPSANGWTETVLVYVLLSGELHGWSGAMGRAYF